VIVHNYFIKVIVIVKVKESLLSSLRYCDFKNCTLCTRCIYVFCICLRTNSDLCHLHKKLIVFITDMKSVYSAVRTGPLNEAVCASSFKG
jgi:hypothetical protein